MSTECWMYRPLYCGDIWSRRNAPKQNRQNTASTKHMTRLGCVSLGSSRIRNSPVTNTNETIGHYQIPNIWFVYLITRRKQHKFYDTTLSSSIAADRVAGGCWSVVASVGDIAFMHSRYRKQLWRMKFWMTYL